MSLTMVLFLTVGVYITQMVLHNKLPMRPPNGNKNLRGFDSSFAFKEEVCEYCGAVFEKQHLLRKHMKNHANETKKEAGAREQREFRCRFCDEAFDKSQALGGHMNRHHDERAKEKVKNVVEMYGMQGVQTLMAQMPQVQQTNILEGQTTPLIPVPSYTPMPAAVNEMELLQDPAHNFNMVPQQTDLSTPSNLHSTSSSPNAWQLTQMLQQQQQQLQLRQAPPSLPAQLQLQHQIFSQSLQLQQQQQQQQFRQQLPQVQLEEQYNPQASLLGHGMVPSRNRVNTRAQTTATTHNMNLGGGPPSTSTGGVSVPGSSYNPIFADPNVNVQVGQNFGVTIDYDSIPESFLMNDVLEDANSPSASMSQGYDGFKKPVTYGSMTH